MALVASDHPLSNLVCHYIFKETGQSVINVGHAFLEYLGGGGENGL